MELATNFEKKCEDLEKEKEKEGFLEEIKKLKEEFANDIQKLKLKLDKYKNIEQTLLQSETEKKELEDKIENLNLNHENILKINNNEVDLKYQVWLNLSVFFS